MSLPSGLLGFALVNLLWAPAPPQPPGPSFEEEEIEEREPEDELVQPHDIPDEIPEPAPHREREGVLKLKDIESLEEIMGDPGNDKSEDPDHDETLDLDDEGSYEDSYQDGYDYNYEDDYEDGDYEDHSLDLTPMPILRFDSGARFPLASTNPIQYSLRVEAGLDLLWQGTRFGVGLRPGVAYRYDHMPSRSSPVRRHLAEVGTSLALLFDFPFSAGYRAVLVAGNAGRKPDKQGVLGLRHGLELGLAHAASSGVVGLSFTHEVLWRPEPEQALAVTAWVDVAQLTAGIIFVVLLVTQ